MEILGWLPCCEAGHLALASKDGRGRLGRGMPFRCPPPTRGITRFQGSGLSSHSASVTRAAQGTPRGGGGERGTLALTLEAVEAASLGDLDLGGEAAGEVLEDDAIGGGKEGEDVLDEVLLVVSQLLPVRHVLREVHLLHGPEGSLRSARPSARTPGSPCPKSKWCPSWIPVEPPLFPSSARPAEVAMAGCSHAATPERCTASRTAAAPVLGAGRE
jgi:hypothetical protein